MAVEWANLQPGFSAMRFPPAPLSFFVFVFWLLAVPMEGPLLTAYGAAGGSRWFLLSHVVALVAIGRWVDPSRLRLLARAGAVATALLSLILPQAAELAPLLLLALGGTAAPLTVSTAVGLHLTLRPARTAAGCLVLANLALAAVQATATLPLWPAFLAFLPLLMMPGNRVGAEEEGQVMPLSWSYLVFVFIFQIVSGLMYAFLYPAYGEQAFAPGLELPFYMAAVMAAVVVYRRDRDLLLAGGLTLAMTAFALLQVGGGWAINLGMFAMQAAAGCIDLFLLALLLASARPVAAFGYGLAVMCGGIAAGQFLSWFLGSASTAVGMAGSLVLNVAALALFLRNHRQQRLAQSSATTGPPPLPAEIACRLSEREISVLSLVLAGNNYRETAQELTISESSIKTYMKRICDKLGVSSRQELLKRIANGSGVPS
ncbi:MAG: helix-turn-helix transcriptional regulator [Desulfuromonadales bacterium]|nr:helix-turn-helix transcriptional regulator [Desulfuromonadales bacterium]